LWFRPIAGIGIATQGNVMHPLTQLFKDREDWLMRRTLDHAKRCAYTKYTSTLEEAWRLSISGLTASLSEGLDRYEDVPELGPDEGFRSDPLAEFGVVEARRHRERGVTLAMFLGLMKYYRLSYLELMAEQASQSSNAPRDRLFIERCFDRIEIAFCQEWSGVSREELLAELQATNRFMTNEKNTYLTAFESLSDPVIMLDVDEKVVNLNNAASLLVDPAHIPGGHYYQPAPRTDGTVPYGKHAVDSTCVGKNVAEVFPWLSPTLGMLKGDARGAACECEATVLEATRLFEVKRSDMLDVSEKLTATIIILRDITGRKRTEEDLRHTVGALGKALSEVKRLSGLLPICANCKKVRDDTGYWQQVEQYVSAHSEATFSHGICPDCVEKLYPGLAPKKP
jgi:PAS domain-containing protein